METKLTYSSKAKNKSTCDFVSKIPLLERYCTPSQKIFLNESVNSCSLKKGTLIFNENFPAFNVYYVESGIISLWKENIFSKKQHIRFINEGGLFGYRGSSMKISTYKLSASAFDDSKIYFIPKNDFLLVLDENPLLHLHIMLNYVKDLERIETNFCYQTTMNTREKVAEALLTFYTIYENKSKLNPFTKAIPRQDIADLAGISVGKTINTLSEFKTDNIIETKGSRIMFTDLEKLKAIVSKYHS